MNVESLIIAKNMVVFNQDHEILKWLKGFETSPEYSALFSCARNDVPVLNVAYREDSILLPGQSTICLSGYTIAHYAPNKIVSPFSGVEYRHLVLVPVSEVSQHSHDKEYMSLLQDILDNGTLRSDRTNTGTLSVFGRQLRFDLEDGVPLLTTKYVAWKACIEELLWFLRGDTNAKHLSEKDVKIWDGNTTRDFLDARGLTMLPEGDIGAGYGFQWRHFGAEYATCKDDYSGKGFDQVREVIRLLKEDPYSRRIFMSAWNPAALSKMALPPCHVSAQFYVEFQNGKKYLRCHMYQRSVDCFLGLPFNIFSYSVLTYILAKMCDMVPKELIISTGDTHIYTDHIDQVRTQLQRVPVFPPKLHLSDAVAHKDMHELTLKDFDIIGYFHHPAIRAHMAV